MRTSAEVYQQIRWDERFDATRFFVLVDVHRETLKRIPFATFVAEGDVPWHRIVAIEVDDEIVWDRRTGIDRLHQTNAGRARTALRLRPPFFSAKTPVRWNEPPEPTERGGAIRVVTWNTLWDRFDADQIATSTRRPLLVTALEKMNADVVALQEVEKPLLDMLLLAEWVRASYALIGGADGDGGLMLLSRLPVLEAAIHVFTPHKAFLAITVRSCDHDIVVATLHLTSDHSERGAERRIEELDEIVSALGAIDRDVVLMGDFNEGGDGPETRLRMRDAWLEVNGAADSTPTFDPTANPLAAISSRLKTAARLDRVILRGAHLKALSTGLEGTEPDAATGVFLSDHYGVRVDIEVDLAIDLSADNHVADRFTSRTALAWLPPESMWPAIQAIRRVHDPQFERWPPHVNVMFGFVPESSFEAAAEVLAKALKQVAPFDVILEGVQTFEHGAGDSTVWLNPAIIAEPWSALIDRVTRSFPHYEKREGTRPHLTLGRTSSPEKVLVEWATTQLGRQTGEVRDLTLLSRRGNEPMRARARVSLGSGEVEWIAEEEENVKPKTTSSPGKIGEIVDRITGGVSGCRVHVTGSRRLACALPDSDLDLVVVVRGPMTEAIFKDKLHRIFREMMMTTSVRAVHARVPGFELRIGDLDVDIALVCTSDIPVEDAVARRAELGAAEALALSAVSDADALIAYVGESRKEAFLDLARTIKKWARARGLDSAAFGSLPGLAWLVLCARTVVDTPPDLADTSLAAHFFAMWAAWDWRVSVSVSIGSIRESSIRRDGVDGDKPICITTPTAPIRSCTTQVGRPMLDLVGRELYRAWELCSSSNNKGSLFALPPMHRRHHAWAVITAENADASGLVRGRMRALILLLEAAGFKDVHAWPRPFVRESQTTFVIGLGPTTSMNQETCSEMGASWAEGLPGISVHWADNGEVPSHFANELVSL